MFYFNQLRENIFFQLNEYDYLSYILPLIDEYGFPDDVKSKLDDRCKHLDKIKEEMNNGKSILF